DRHLVAVVTRLLGQLPHVVVGEHRQGAVGAVVLAGLDAQLAGQQAVAPVVIVLRHARGGPAAGEGGLLGQVASPTPLVTGAAVTVSRPVVGSVQVMPSGTGVETFCNTSRPLVVAT